MRIIDVLNKIAQGDNVCTKTNEFFRKITANINYKELEEGLNSEVEIIEDVPKEDKKIEKIEERIDTGLVGTEILDEFKVAGAINKQASYIFDIAKKINEIIDKVNGDSNE